MPRRPQPIGASTVVPVGLGAEGFDLSPDGRELWVANAQGGSVSIVNVAKKAAETVSVRFRSANRLKFTPDGKYALISDLGGTEVIVMDAATRQEIKRIDVGGGAAGIQMSADGSRAFAAVGSQNGVAIIDLKTLSMTGRIATGPGPDGLAWVAGTVASSGGCAWRRHPPYTRSHRPTTAVSWTMRPPTIVISEVMRAMRSAGTVR